MSCSVVTLSSPLQQAIKFKLQFRLDLLLGNKTGSKAILFRNNSWQKLFLNRCFVTLVQTTRNTIRSFTVLLNAGSQLTVCSFSKKFCFSSLKCDLLQIGVVQSCTPCLALIHPQVVLGSALAHNARFVFMFCCLAPCGFDRIAGYEPQALRSPGWPGEYDNFLDCVWFLRASSPNKQIRINFESFQTETCCDYLKVCICIRI